MLPESGGQSKKTWTAVGQWHYDSMQPHHDDGVVVYNYDHQPTPFEVRVDLQKEAEEKIGLHVTVDRMSVSEVVTNISVVSTHLFDV